MEPKVFGGQVAMVVESAKQKRIFGCILPVSSSNCYTGSVITSLSWMAAGIDIRTSPFRGNMRCAVCLREFSEEYPSMAVTDANAAAFSAVSGVVLLPNTHRICLRHIDRQSGVPSRDLAIKLPKRAKKGPNPSSEHIRAADADVRLCYVRLGKELKVQIERNQDLQQQQVQQRQQQDERDRSPFISMIRWGGLDKNIRRWLGARNMGAFVQFADECLTWEKHHSDHYLPFHSSESSPRRHGAAVTSGEHDPSPEYLEHVAMFLSHLRSGLVSFVRID